MGVSLHVRTKVPDTALQMWFQGSEQMTPKVKIMYTTMFQGRRPSSMQMALLGNMVISCLGSGLLWFCFDRLVIVYSVPKPGLNE